jgi:hypothetical protein
MADLILPVPYYSQRDSETNQAMRMCFSSSCAMLVSALRPGFFKGKMQPDDQYLINYVKPRGDTTIAAVQVAALKACGVSATFSQSATWATVDKQLAAGIPVPFPFYHHGPASKPYGGHWIIIVGRSADGQAYICHDPYGEADLVNGGYLHTNGHQRRYSKQNLSKRGQDTHGHIWAILAQKPTQAKAA